MVRICLKSRGLHLLLLIFHQVLSHMICADGDGVSVSVDIWFQLRYPLIFFIHHCANDIV